MDDLKICDRCGSDACYVQEVNNEITNYQCYGCGFVTNTLLKKGTKFFEEQMELLPNLYKELMGEDDDGKIWMPSTINMPQMGMIFANGKSAEKWNWAGVLSVPVKEEEKEKYPIPNKEGEFYEWRMDMSTIKEFPESDYIEALDYIGIFSAEEK
jgi:hypothetical protein|tara:strand:+ start:2684 stop:3148 length:465 start_codon:yes stop_codon:yes gene_type:complete